jgi:very-short-patch-repair endonuclease
MVLPTQWGGAAEGGGGASQRRTTVNRLASQGRGCLATSCGMPPIRTVIARRMRKSMTLTEAQLWARLKGRQLEGWKFRRQHPIGSYFVDFYCPKARLVVEVDGPAHYDDVQGLRDQIRQAWLVEHGHRVLRIDVQDIDRDITEVLDRIYGELAPPAPSAPPPRERGGP